MNVHLRFPIIAILATACSSEPEPQIVAADGCYGEPAPLDEPIPEAGGRTAQEVFDEANDLYASIQATVTEVEPSDPATPRSWDLVVGMVFTTLLSAETTTDAVDACGVNGSDRLILHVKALTVGDVVSGPIDAKLIADDRGWVLPSYQATTAPTGPLGDAMEADGVTMDRVDTSIGGIGDWTYQEIGDGVHLHVMPHAAWGNSYASCSSLDGCLSLDGYNDDDLPWNQPN